MSIILRKLNKSDNKSLSSLANNINIWNSVRDYFPHPYSLKDANTFIELTQKENPQYTFAIEFDKKLCGVISIDIKNDVYRKNGELGYWIGEPFWGKGIVTKAVEIIVNYGFSKLKLERIYAGVFSFNTGSMKALEKNDFMKEGIFKNTIFKNGKLLNEHQYSILKDDYFS